MYSWMALVYSQNCVIIITIKFRTFLSPPKNPHTRCSHTPFSQTLSALHSHYFFLWIWLFLIFHINGSFTCNMYQYLVLFYHQKYSVLWIYYIVFIHLPVDGFSGYSSDFFVKLTELWILPAIMGLHSAGNLAGAPSSPPCLSPRCVSLSMTAVSPTG